MRLVMLVVVAACQSERAAENPPSPPRDPLAPLAPGFGPETIRDDALYKLLTPTDAVYERVSVQFRRTRHCLSAYSGTSEEQMLAGAKALGLDCTNGHCADFRREVSSLGQVCVLGSAVDEAAKSAIFDEAIGRSAAQYIAVKSLEEQLRPYLRVVSRTWARFLSNTHVSLDFDYQVDRGRALELIEPWARSLSLRRTEKPADKFSPGALLFECGHNGAPDCGQAGRGIYIRVTAGMVTLTSTTFERE